MELVRKFMVVLGAASVAFGVDYFLVEGGKLNDTIVVIIITICFYVMSMPKKLGMFIILTLIFMIIPVLQLFSGIFPQEVHTRVLICSLLGAVMFSLIAMAIAIWQKHKNKQQEEVS